MRRFIAARTLTSYPQGRYRWTLVGLTVLASIATAYPFQLAPLLPILLPYLGMSHSAYGLFFTFAILCGAATALYGGPLADRLGRVVLIDICLGAAIVLVFLNLLITDIVTFVVIRTAMALVSGLMASAGAALVRDMSPRMSRALAFGLFTLGPVGASFLANFIAGATLPIWHTWQSQIWIMGIIMVALYVPIFAWLKDLSPVLRLQIFRDEIAALEARGKLPKASEVPSSTRAAFAALLGHPEIWLLVIAVAASLTMIFTLTAFGPLMFTEAFGYSPAEAARLNAYFWLANAAALVVTGYVSDRLQLRKPIAIAGGVCATAVMGWWISTFSSPLEPTSMAILATVLGCFFAMGYVPWAAQFSETLEDLAPALQATGWSLFALVFRGWIAVSAPLALYVAMQYGWAAWAKVALGGTVMFVVVMLFTRRHGAAVATVAREAPSAGGGN
jgi:OPA family glycerol-3-phosphate transporter-like MFS transporter